MAILGNVDRTTYTDYTTRSGKRCLLVTHILSYGEEVRRYLFKGSKEWRDFLRHRTAKGVSNMSVEEAVQMGRTGRILPTENITFVRDGKFHKVVDEKVGSWDPAFSVFLKEAKELFGDITVIEVKG